MNKKQVIPCEDRILAKLQELGTEVPATCEGHREFVIHSPFAGEYRCTLWSYRALGWDADGADFTGRFTDPDRARKYCDCNPYSGKYNNHLCLYDSPDDRAAQVCTMLEMLTTDYSEIRK